MNPLLNPFSPGAGSQPPELAGRQEILDQALLTLERVKLGRSERSFFLVGLRGVGKTVVLQKILALATQNEYQACLVEAHENKPLSLLLLPQLRRILFSLDSAAQISSKVKRGLRVLKSFMSGLKLKAYDIEVSLDIDSEVGAADSGDLEADLSQVFLALGEAAQDRGTAVAILIDEMQYLSEKELSALIMAIHQMAQKALPVVVIGAGLPQLVGQAVKSKSYAERLLTYPSLGPLSQEAAEHALQEPVRLQGMEFTSEAIQKIIQATQGYPYFLQEWGYQAWKFAEKSPIDAFVIQEASKVALSRLDENFFRARFDRLTPREKDYLRALAEFGEAPQRSGVVAERLGLDVKTAAPLRNSLIKKGMIYSPTHGDTAFTVPLFDKFMMRVIPAFSAQE